MNYKIICTGNPNKKGIPKAVLETFENVDFISLSTGYDLTSNEGQEYFKNIIKNYNVFINIAQLSNGAQEQLLKIAQQSGMKGHVFNIGSIAEYKRWEWYDADYTAEKRSLRETSLELCTEFFKTTHIITGGFQDATSDHPDRMDPVEIVNAIKYVLSSKINIPIIGVEKINDIEMEEQLKVKNGKV
jgi:NADP-dependent 3-hydroxy acid dehydrogenase YdfG